MCIRDRDEVGDQQADQAEDQHRDRVSDPVLFALRIDSAEPVGQALEGTEDGIEPGLAVRIEDAHEVKSQRLRYQKKGGNVERELKPGIRIVHGARSSIEGRERSGQPARSGAA